MIRRVLVGASMRTWFLCMMTAAISAPAVFGQTSGGSSDEWKFKVAPYLIFPYMDGKAAVRGREVDIDVGAGDIFSHLQMGGMGYFEARKGAWGFGVDAIYMALGTTIDIPPANVDFDQCEFTFMGLRSLNDRVNLTFGARWNIIRGNIEFKGPVLGTVLDEVGDTKQWVDPIVGLQIHQPLGGRWHFGLTADIGGFGAGSDFAWHVFPTIGIDLGKRTRLGFGYRALGMDYDTGSGNTLFRYDVITSGPVVGVAFSF